MASLFQGEQRRAMVIGLGGLGLVLVLFVGSRLLSGGGGEDDLDAPIEAPTTTTAPGVPAGPGTAGGADGDASPVIPIPDLPDAFEIRELRDPFTPPLQLILDEQLPGGNGDGTGTPGDGGGGTGDGSEPSARVDLKSVETDDDGDPFAVVEVDGQTFRPAEGETFGPNDEFFVVSLDVEDQCGLFLFGDEPFTECVDDSIPQK